MVCQDLPRQCEVGAEATGSLGALSSLDESCFFESAIMAMTTTVIMAKFTLNRNL